MLNYWDLECHCSLWIWGRHSSVHSSHVSNLPWRCWAVWGALLEKSRGQNRAKRSRWQCCRPKSGVTLWGRGLCVKCHLWVHTIWSVHTPPWALGDLFHCWDGVMFYQLIKTESKKNLNHKHCKKDDFLTLNNLSQCLTNHIHLSCRLTLLFDWGRVKQPWHSAYQNIWIPKSCF